MAKETLQLIWKENNQFNKLAGAKLTPTSYNNILILYGHKHQHES